MKKITAAIFLLNLALLASQLVLANFRAGDGDKVVQLEKQTEILATENSQLEAEIYSASSLSYIQSQAQANHLQPIATIELAPLDLAAASATSRP